MKRVGLVPLANSLANLARWRHYRKMPDKEYCLAKAARLWDVAASLAELEPNVAQEMLDLAEKFEVAAQSAPSE